MNTSHKYFKATCFNADVYAAVDAAAEKLERQFKKLRKLLKNHKRPELSKEGRLDQMNDRFEHKVFYRKAA